MNTSEINKEAVVSYAAIHCGLTPELINTYPNYPSRNEMAQQLADINFGYEPEKDKTFDWFKLVKRKNKDLEKYWLACKLSNNLGDINKIEFSIPLSCIPTPENKMLAVNFTFDISYSPFSCL